VNSTLAVRDLIRDSIINYVVVHHEFRWWPSCYLLARDLPTTSQPHQLTLNQAALRAGGRGGSGRCDSSSPHV